MNLKAQPPPKCRNQAGSKALSLRSNSGWPQGWQGILTSVGLLMNRKDFQSNNPWTKRGINLEVRSRETYKGSSENSARLQSCLCALRWRQMQNRSGITALLHSYTRAQVPTASEEILLGQQVRTWLDWPKGEQPPRSVIRAGMRAKRRLFEGNLRLVVHVAKKHKQVMGLSDEDFQDSIQNGCIGLNRAIEKFDPETGYKFSTYAFWWLRQSIGRGDLQRRMIRIPDQPMKDFKTLDRAINQLRDEGIQPNAKLLSEITGLTERQVQERSEIGKMLLVNSLDNVVHDDGSALLDLISDVTNGARGEGDEIKGMREQVAPHLKHLNDRERFVVERKLAGDNHRAIGQDLSISTTRVGQLWRVATDKIIEGLEREEALVA